jgi:hypothetical protein
MTDSPPNPSFKPLNLLRSKWTALFSILLVVGGLALQFWLPNQRCWWAIERLKAADCLVNFSIERRGPDWLRSRVGDELMKVLDEPKEIAVLKTPPEFGDQDLHPIVGLTDLRYLHLENTRVSDEGLNYLAGLEELNLLGLSGTDVGDDGLKYLDGLANLHILWLDSTRTSDEGLVHLAGLTQLRTVRLENTLVSDEGVAQLQRALPDCTIYRD